MNTKMPLQRQLNINVLPVGFITWQLQWIYATRQAKIIHMFPVFILGVGLFLRRRRYGVTDARRTKARYTINWSAVPSIIASRQCSDTSNWTQQGSSLVILVQVYKEK